MATEDPPVPPPPPPPPAAAASDFPLPKTLTYPSSAAPELVAQGAEGRLYRTTHLVASLAGALKYRPPKAWRHPALDARLTRHRILAEARVLARCRRAGARHVPAVYALDEAAGWIMLEWIEGPPVRVAINAWLAAAKKEEEAGERRRRRRRRRRRWGGEGGGVEEEGEEEEEEVEMVGGGERGGGEGDGGGGGNEPLVRLMRRIGDAVGRLHKIGIVHGDLTTSNMMLRPWEKGGQQQPVNGNAAGGDNDDVVDDKLLDGEIVIIDFGLASVGTADEDRAVDLYVLERAFASTHPRAEPLFSAVLDAYRGTFKQAPVVLKKLEEVRMRGRKRSMLG